MTAENNISQLVEAIDDEFVLRTMWQKEENIAIRRHIRSRMFQLRELRLLALRDDSGKSGGESGHRSPLTNDEAVTGGTEEPPGDLPEDSVDACQPPASVADMAVMAAVCSDLMGLQPQSRPSSSLLVHESNGSESEGSDRPSPGDGGRESLATLLGPVVDRTSPESPESAANTALLATLLQSPLDDVDLELHDGEIIATLPATERCQRRFVRAVWQFADPAPPCCAQLNSIVNQVQSGSVIDLHSHMADGVARVVDVSRHSVEGFGGKVIYQLLINLLVNHRAMASLSSNCESNSEQLPAQTDLSTKCQRTVEITVEGSETKVDVGFSEGNDKDIAVVIENSGASTQHIKESLAKYWGFSSEEIDYVVTQVVNHEAKLTPEISCNKLQYLPQPNPDSIVATPVNRPVSELDAPVINGNVSAPVDHPKIETVGSKLKENKLCAPDNSVSTVQSSTSVKYGRGGVMNRVNVFEKAVDTSKESAVPSRKPARKISMNQDISVKSRAASWERMASESRLAAESLPTSRSQSRSRVRESSWPKTVEASKARPSLPESISVSIVVKTAIIIFRESNTNKVHEFCLRHQSSCPTVAELSAELSNAAVKDAKDLDAFVAAKSNTDVSEVPIEVIDGERYRKYRRTVLIPDGTESSEKRDCFTPRTKDEVDKSYRVSRNNVNLESLPKQQSGKLKEFNTNKTPSEKEQVHVERQNKANCGAVSLIKRNHSPVKSMVEKMTNLNRAHIQTSTDSCRDAIDLASDSKREVNNVRKLISELNAKTASRSTENNSKITNIISNSKINQCPPQENNPKKKLPSLCLKTKLELSDKTSEEVSHIKDVTDSPAAIEIVDSLTSNSNKNDHLKISSKGTTLAPKTTGGQKQENFRQHSYNTVKSKLNFFEKIANRTETDSVPRVTPVKSGKHLFSETKLGYSLIGGVRGANKFESNQNEFGQFGSIHELVDQKVTKLYKVDEFQETDPHHRLEQETAKQVVSKVMEASLRRIRSAVENNSDETDARPVEWRKEETLETVESDHGSDVVDQETCQRERQNSIFDDPSLPIPIGEEVELNDSDFYDVSFVAADDDTNSEGNIANTVSPTDKVSSDECSQQNAGRCEIRQSSLSNRLDSERPVYSGQRHRDGKPTNNFLRRVSFIGEIHEDIRSDANSVQEEVIDLCSSDDPPMAISAKVCDIVQIMNASNRSKHSVDVFTSKYSSSNRGSNAKDETNSSHKCSRVEEYGSQTTVSASSDGHHSTICDQPGASVSSQCNFDLNDVVTDAIPSNNRVSNFKNLVFNHESGLLINTKHAPIESHDVAYQPVVHARKHTSTVGDTQSVNATDADECDASIVPKATDDQRAEQCQTGNDETGMKQLAGELSSSAQQVASEEHQRQRDVSLITDHRLLEKMIDRCQSYEDRLKIRARIRQLRSQ